ncbi:unnamed protein product [Heterobilharzia americana]|nr:unnamed protein product [Heterobilharzia americana]
MYMIYEAFNGIVDRITTFQNYEYLLNSELRPAIDQVYNLMDKLVAFSKEEKEHQAVVDVLTANLKNMEASLDENKQQLVEYGSQLMRKKVLLNTKKKAREADAVKKAEESDSFVRERQFLRARLCEIKRNSSATLEQENLEQRQLEAVSKNRVYLEELNKSLLQLYQLVVQVRSSQ